MWQPWKCTSRVPWEDSNWWMATSGNAESTTTLISKTILPMSCFHQLLSMVGTFRQATSCKVAKMSDSWLWLKNSHWLSQNFFNATVLESANPTLLPSFSPFQELSLHYGVLCTLPLSLQLFPLVSGKACIMLPWCLLLKRPNKIMQNHIYGEEGLQALSMCCRIQP